MPSQGDWETQKDVIRDLYLTQNYTLKALMERMHSAGFIATKSQYETKFKVWGLSKNDTNISAATWKHVGYKMAKRKREVDNSAVFIDGVEVNQKRVKKEISRYTYSTIERVQLERAGAPSPPGPLIMVASPPSSQPAFKISHWPDSLPWLAFVRSLNTHLVSLHQPDQASRAFQQEPDTPQPRASDVLSSPNDEISTAWRKSTYINTARDRMDLIRAILPGSSDNDRAAEIQNNISLLSTTSSHWALKLLVYLASNKLLRSEDLDCIWRLVEESGVKELAALSKSLDVGETSLKAALEFMFEAGIHQTHTDIVSWLLDFGIDPNRKIRSRNRGGSHLPLVLAIIDHRLPSAEQMVCLLISKGASPLLICCKRHNTACHLAALKPNFHLKSLLLAASSAQDHQLSAQHAERYGQDETYRECYEKQEDEETTFRQLNLLVELLEKSFPPSLTLVSPKALIRAVKSNNHRLIRLIHQRGLSMNCSDSRLCSPLEIAVAGEGDKLKADVRVDTVELLLELGASPNYNPRTSRRDLCSLVLQTAINGLHPQKAKLVEILMKNDAKIKGTISCGQKDHQTLMDCALSVASTSGAILYQEIPILLHDAGLPFPTRTPLVYYLEALSDHFPNGLRGSMDRFLSTLISETTDLLMRSKRGWTALDYALSMGLTRAGNLMFEKGAVHSRKFIHEYCLYTSVDLGDLDTLFGRVPPPRSDKRRRSWLFYKVIGTLRAALLHTADPRAERVTNLLQDYCKLPRSPKREAYIILQACVTRDKYIIGITLERFPNTYSATALEELIWYQTENCFDCWKFIEELLRRRSDTTSSLQTLHEQRILFQVAYSALTGKGDMKVVEWFHELYKEPFQLVNLRPSAFLMDVFYRPNAHTDHVDIPLKFRTRYPTSCLDNFNISQWCKYGFKVNTYLGLLLASRGRVDEMSHALYHGLRPNERFSWSLTLLQLVVARRDLPMARQLLEAKADVEALAPWRNIPYTIWKRIPDTICKLLTTDDKRRTRRRSALQLAVEQGDLPMIKLLLEFGANVNGPPAPVRGATALQIACIKGYIDIARLLISSGADVNAEGAGCHGRTALEGAAEHGRLDMVFLLLERGCLVHDSFRRQYVRAVGLAQAQAHYILAMKLRDYGDWTEHDSDVLWITGLTDYQPKFAEDLKDEPRYNEGVGETNSDVVHFNPSDLFRFQQHSEDEFTDSSSTSEDENYTVW